MYCSHFITTMCVFQVRMMLRSFEANGLFIKSEEHPTGIIGKIFIVYNKVNGNGKPTWLKDAPSNVIAVPHSHSDTVSNQSPL